MTEKPTLRSRFKKDYFTIFKHDVFHPSKKGITQFMLTLMFAFCWQSNAQIVVNQNFGADGYDSAPTILTINAGDITVNGSNTIQELTVLLGLRPIVMIGIILI